MTLMLRSLLIVGVGSFFGGAMRYLVSTLMKNVGTSGFPWGTLTVNLLGCLVFGVVFALFNRSGAAHGSWCLLLTTGLCGGFTTFSTFSHEGFRMLHDGNMGGFVAYVLASLVLGVLLVALGYWIVKAVDLS